MIRTYMQQNSEWFANSDPFSNIGDMESEIAELRTLTKVTQLRKQIECREEGAWMVVKDIPDDKAPSGVRKVTSYGVTKRSVTRSVSSNVGFSKGFSDEMPAEPLVQLADEESDQDFKPSSVEITEVFDEPLRRDIPEFNMHVIPEKPTNKKTSVVTLGKGNLVLIDPEEDESNFHVTGISKGKVADVVNTLEKSNEKKVKKVGFCKTEVHFAPDSGKINIVETDEKPPPTQVYRKKKRNRGSRNRGGNSLPKHYFGDMDDFGEDSNQSNESDKEDSSSPFHDPQDAKLLSSIREKLPTFERTIKSEGKDTKYRHSSPEKLNFDIEKIESEGKEFFKKVKQPSFRDKFLKETSHIPEKLHPENHSNVNDLVKNLDKHPRLKDNLYIYGSRGFSSQEKELLKSHYKLSDDDYATLSNMKSSSNKDSDFYHGRKEVSNNDVPYKEEESSHNLRYTDLLKFPSSHEKDADKYPSDETNKPEVRNIPIVQTDCVSESDYVKSKRNSISDIVLDISRVSRLPLDQDVKSSISFLGNVSPKLQNLIQNSVEHEFQLRQKQILQKRSAEEKKQTQSNDRVKTSVTLNLATKTDNKEIVVSKKEPKLKPVKIVTQVHLGPETEAKHEFQLKREEITKNLFNEPIYDNKDVKLKETPYLLNEEPVPAPRGKKEPVPKKEESKVPPKPKPRTVTSISVEKSRTSKTPTTRVASRTDSSISSKRVRSKESITKSRESDRSHSRPVVSKDEGKSRKSQNQDVKSDTVTSRSARVVKVTPETKGKKVTREPLRSFEKVSNGWVGHIVPLKQEGITVTTKVYSSRAGVQRSQGSGSRRSTQTSSTVKTSHSLSSRLDSSRESKQFSLSKEHLSSAKLVKQVSPRRGSNARKVEKKVDSRIGVDSYRPRTRQESERSDDSVIQADEEVRAYMFDGHKNKRK
ncbi:myb-like protein V isoform X2 [Halyomorpha halys]|uniref:myb-like protein V isoform X2 n=1 Tax=Halyomorpha halys TaxID=286706 RepID=UPI0006D503B1|nr:uncharacterized protein LOC106681916 isoform X2 [Halyomorpha halys]